MRIPLLLVPLLASACVASMAAQSTKGQVSPPPQSTPDIARRAPEFQLQLPETDRSGQNGTRIERFQTPASLPMPIVAHDPQQSTTCYFIQAYRFARTTPESDAVKLTGVSTCQPASEFQMKDIVSRP